MLTKEQWKSVEAELSFSEGYVEFKADGDKLVAQVFPRGDLRYCIFVRLNDQNRCEAVKKFHRPCTRFLHTKAERDTAAKDLRKRGLSDSWKSYLKGVIEKKITHYRSYWTSAASFARHLRKTCTDVELVKIGY